LDAAVRECVAQRLWNSDLSGAKAPQILRGSDAGLKASSSTGKKKQVSLDFGRPAERDGLRLG